MKTLCSPFIFRGYSKLGLGLILDGFWPFGDQPAYPSVPPLYPGRPRSSRAGLGPRRLGPSLVCCAASRLTRRQLRTESRLGRAAAVAPPEQSGLLELAPLASAIRPTVRLSPLLRTWTFTGTFGPPALRTGECASGTAVPSGPELTRPSAWPRPSAGVWHGYAMPAPF